MPYIVLGYRRVTRAVWGPGSAHTQTASPLTFRSLRCRSHRGSHPRARRHSVISASTSISIIMAGSTSRVTSTIVEAGRMA